MPTDSLQPWQHYRRPFVKDLAFALACPDILTHWISPNSHIVSPDIAVHTPDFWPAQYRNYAQRLHELDTTNAYQDLTRYLMSRPSPYRLGFHFEGLMHFWLEDGYQLGLHPYEVVAHNVQLYQGNQTTGELDFILRNHQSGEIEHWELAVKFYIGSPPYGFANWVGINSRDTLERKLTHMQTKPFRSIWVDLDFYEKVKIDRRYAVMKGRFFQPESAQGTRPDWLNEHFPRHLWHPINNERDFLALDPKTLRPTHYIEWFTARPFYDASYLTAAAPKLSEDEIEQLDVSKQEKRLRRIRYQQWPYQTLKFESLKTGLYMQNSTPLVLIVN